MSRLNVRNSVVRGLLYRDISSSARHHCVAGYGHQRDVLGWIPRHATDAQLLLCFLSASCGKLVVTHVDQV